MKNYKHKLCLIERTKLLEGIQCQSITFTNSLGNTYTDNQIGVQTEINSTTLDSYPLIKLKTPQEKNIPFDVPSPKEILDDYVATHNNINKVKITDYSFIPRNDVIVTIKNGEQTDSYSSNGAKEDEYNNFINKGYTIMPETYVSLSYYFEISYESEYDGKQQPSVLYEEITINIPFIVFINNRYPNKQWTFTDAVNRVLQLAEPLYKGEEPRFKLNNVQAEKYANTYIPETTMTSCTLREQLKHLGNFIHAEPRLGGYDENGVYQDNWIFFDEYGGTEASTLQGKKYVYNNVKQGINDYCTEIDTTAKNVVNTLDYGQGVVYSPDAKNVKSVRTESINTRLQESNCIIATEFPIYDVIDISCTLFYKDDEDNLTSYDFGSIRPYVYESHEYNSILSSYGGTYPYSKAYAIYYTQGENNLKGLFFKPTEKQEAYTGSNYLTKYSIVNILESLNKEKPPSDIKSKISENFGYLSFNVSYIPIYNTRFKHSKGYLSKEKQLPFAKIYNQSENVVETRYYGENVKGIAQRIGNQEATRTYIYGALSDIPKTGTLLDGYYISSVATEFTNNYIKSTVGLTKNFNRLSQNVGIDSHKRVYEVSEREAYDRDVTIKEYICIGDDTEMPYMESKMQIKQGEYDVPSSILSTTWGTFGQLGGENDTTLQSVAILSTKTSQGNPIKKVKAPVISSAFGNSMIFSFKMKDNYSAGETVSPIENSFAQTNEDEIKDALWQTDMQYCDYYGKAYYCDIALGHNVVNASKLSANAENESLNDSKIVLSDYLLRKDSREKLNFNLEIEYVTNRQDLIIGSLAQNNTLVTTKTRSTPARLYFFDEKISRYKKSLFINENDSIDNLIGSYDITVNADNIIFEIPSDIDSFAAWAIAFPPSKKTSKMYNEETNKVEDIPEYIDGEILIACNNGSDYYKNNNNQISETIYFKAYRDKIKD